MSAVGIEELPAIGPAAVTLGVFDGVHAGHLHLLRSVGETARRLDARSVALIFEPPPEEVLRPGRRVARLSPPDERRDLVRAAGIDHAVTLRFDDALRQLSPEAFLAAFAPAIELRAIVMTAEASFGRGRAGTLDRVSEIGAHAGFEVVAVDRLLVDGAPVSSTRVRASLAAGDIGDATRLLGRAPSFVGTVVHGDHRGHELGFPTANLAFAYEPALPALGIYLGRVTVASRGVGPGHPALVSVGVRPTFVDDGHVLVEAYLLDFDGDLYDAELRLELGDRLRDERRFDGVDALVTQMRADEAEARRRLGIAGSSGVPREE